jgi:pantetheine-phosphate adenylyltransferase
VPGQTTILGLIVIAAHAGMAKALYFGLKTLLVGGCKNESARIVLGFSPGFLLMTTPDVKPSSAVYVGSFDPMTLGHLDIIRRAARIFGHVTVGIGINPDKKTLFSSSDRVEMCRASVKDLGNVEVLTFDGLAVEFVRLCGSRILLRGVRTLTDIEAEFTMTLTNRVLDQEIESVFLMSADRYAHISSSLIKQIARMSKADVRTRLRDFVPTPVIEPLIAKLHSQS